MSVIETKDKINYEASILTKDIETLQEQVKDKVSKLEEIINNKENEIFELKKYIDNTNIGSYYTNGTIQALKIFKNIHEFNKYVEGLYKIKKWTIRSESYKESEDEFNSKKLTNRPITEEQVISFFDTLYIMYQVVNNINNVKLQREMKIIMEYVIPEPAKNRIDYVLCYRNTLFLIEFSKAKNINTITEEEQTKYQQVSNYASKIKQEINNENIKIRLKACMYLDESKNENIETNNKTINDLVKKIKEMDEDNLNAYEHLSKIE